MDSKQNFACTVCGLHYAQAATAAQCAAWCTAHKSCNMDITALSIERAGNAQG